VFRTVTAVQSPALENIDIAEFTGVGKVGLDDIVSAVEWRTWVRPGTNSHGMERGNEVQETDQGDERATCLRGVGAAAATIGVGSEGAGTQCGMNAAAVGRTDCTK
jgi:hypothetical protein